MWNRSCDEAAAKACQKVMIELPMKSFRHPVLLVRKSKFLLFWLKFIEYVAKHLVPLKLLCIICSFLGFSAWYILNHIRSIQFESFILKWFFMRILGPCESVPCFKSSEYKETGFPPTGAIYVYVLWQCQSWVQTKVFSTSHFCAQSLSFILCSHISQGYEHWTVNPQAK